MHQQNFPFLIIFNYHKPRLICCGLHGVNCSLTKLQYFDFVDHSSHQPFNLSKLSSFNFDHFKIFGWKCHLRFLTHLYPKNLECLVGAFTPAPGIHFGMWGGKFHFKSLSMGVASVQTATPRKPSNSDCSPGKVKTPTGYLNCSSVLLDDHPGILAFIKPGLLLIWSELYYYVNREVC